MDELDKQINDKLDESFRVMGINKIEEEEETKDNEEVEEKAEETKDNGDKEQVSTKMPDITEEQYTKLITQSYAVASLPLIKLLKKTTGVDYTHFLFEEGKELKKTAEIEFRRTDEKKQFSLYLDIVDKDYSLNYGKYGEIKETREALVNQCLRLISFTQFLYNHIRDKKKELLEHHLILDSNSTLYLDINEKKRIGIRFEARKYTEPTTQ